MLIFFSQETYLLKEIVLFSQKNRDLSEYINTKIYMIETARKSIAKKM